jgi:rare lipoprotein A
MLGMSAMNEPTLQFYAAAAARRVGVAVLVAALGGCVPTTPPSPPSPASPAGVPARVVLPGAPDSVAAPATTPIPAPERLVLATQTGAASFYANSLAGRPTASGAPYDPTAFMAAHREYPFGTVLRVTNPANGRSVEVVVLDRGPFVAGRIVDLSRVAAESLDMIRQGVVQVIVEVLEWGR